MVWSAVGNAHVICVSEARPKCCVSHRPSIWGAIEILDTIYVVLKYSIGGICTVRVVRGRYSATCRCESTSWPSDISYVVATRSL